MNPVREVVIRAGTRARAAGDQAISAFPDIPLSARANRAFQRRVVLFLAGEAGIRQFLDIGTGIPTASRWR